MKECLNSKPIIGIASGGFDDLTAREIIQICTSALQDISNVLAQNIIEKNTVLYNDKAAAKLIKKYIDDAVFWHNAGRPNRSTAEIKS